MAVWKRCTHDGKTRSTGLPARGKRPAIPACRCGGGAWYWRADAGTSPGGSRVQTSGSAPTKREAEAALRDFRARADAGKAVTDRGLTVEKWLQRWLADGQWKPKARAGYESDIRLYLIPHLGEVLLQELKRRNVRDMIKAMAAGGKSGHVIDKARRTLRAALSAAVQDERVPANVADGRFPEIPKRRRRPGEVLEPVKTSRVVTAAEGDPLHSLEVVLSLTGLRRGELLGARWEMDVSLTGEFPGDYPGMTIRQTVVELPGEHPCPVCSGTHRGRFIQQSTDDSPGAKSEAGTDRWVALPAPAVAVLLKHQAEQNAHKEKVGDLYVDHGLVWAGPCGEPLRPDAVSKRHRELTGVDMKTFRRGAVSMMVATGVPVEVVQAASGHADDQVMKDHYLRALRVQLSGAADDVVRLMAGGDGSSGLVHGVVHIPPIQTERRLDSGGISSDRLDADGTHHHPVPHRNNKNT